MELEEALDKLKAAESKVETLEGELKAEQGKSAQILADKRKFKEERDTLAAEAEKVKLEGMTAEERVKAEIEAKDKLAAELQAKLEETQTGYAKEKREARLANIAAGLKAASGIDAKTINTLVKANLSGVEDLSDESKVTEAINSLKESNKGLFAADVPSGSGGKHESGGGSNEGVKDSYVKSVWSNVTK